MTETKFVLMGSVKSVFSYCITKENSETPHYAHYQFFRTLIIQLRRKRLLLAILKSECAIKNYELFQPFEGYQSISVLIVF